MLEASISPERHFGYSKNVYGLKKRTSCIYGIRYLLACINSKAVDFYYKKKFSTKKTDVFPEIQTYLYEQLPIPPASDNVHSQIESLVDKALSTSNKGYAITELEQEIDLLVYQLYGLSYDEVLVVDPETKITREEYEKGMGE